MFITFNLKFFFNPKPLPPGFDFNNLNLGNRPFNYLTWDSEISFSPPCDKIAIYCDSNFTRNSMGFDKKNCAIHMDASTAEALGFYCGQQIPFEPLIKAIRKWIKNPSSFSPHYCILYHELIHVQQHNQGQSKRQCQKEREAAEAGAECLEVIKEKHCPNRPGCNILEELLDEVKQFIIFQNCLCVSSPQVTQTTCKKCLQAFFTAIGADISLHNKYKFCLIYCRDMAPSQSPPLDDSMPQLSWAIEDTTTQPTAPDTNQQFNQPASQPTTQPADGMCDWIKKPTTQPASQPAGSIKSED